jgi:hypothetical protein
LLGVRSLWKFSASGNKLQIFVLADGSRDEQASKDLGLDDHDAAFVLIRIGDELDFPLACREGAHDRLV